MFSNKKNKSSEIFIILLALICFSYALFIAIRYANQIPLDMFHFRQTQTALTAYWLVKNGFSLAYETPVAGPPWSIPFEFPIYQYIVALTSKITKCPLNFAGRVISFLFLALCLIPAREITKNLNLSNLVFYIFAALLFSSPLYLYWGRSFMIETTAVFFSVAAIKYFIDIVQKRSSLKYTSLFLIFIILSILQKATTGLPVLAILGLVYLFLSIKELPSNLEGQRTSTYVFLTKKIMLALLYFGIPLVIGAIWALYTDHIKMLNGLGVNLTSSALTKWNWGSISQRLSFELYSDVLWGRIFVQNLSGALGATILMFVLISNAKNSIKWIIIISILMGLVPLFLFTNLHIRHGYYQTGNLIFLIYAIAVCLGHVLNQYLDKKIIIVLLTMIMVGYNYFWFATKYLNIVKTEFNKVNARDYDVSEILKREIPQGKSFIAFGNDWNSSFTYLAERKSFTVPGFFKEYKKISFNPENFIDEAQLGAIVVCLPVKSPTINNLTQWSSTNRNWKIGEAHGCYIAVPQTTPVDNNFVLSSTECQGGIEFAGYISESNQSIIAVTGWTTISGQKWILPEKTYVTLTKKNDKSIFFETLQVNRQDVNAHFGQPNIADAGFSRIINTTSLSGEYIVGLVRLNRGRHEVCQFQKKVLINGDIHE